MNFKRFHESKNLFDISKVVSNVNVANQGDSLKVTTPSTTTGVVAGSPYTLQTYCPNLQVGDVVTLSFVSTGSSKLIYLQGENITWVSGQSKTITSTMLSSAVVWYASGVSTEAIISNIMLNTGSTPLPYEPYSSEVWHDVPYYLHNTSTDTIATLPADIYANDTTATVGISGNTVQNGTPTPDSPIQPSECGERTGNYLPTPVSATVESSGITIESSGDGIINVSGTRTSGDSPTINLKESVTFNGTYYVHLRNNAVAPSSVIVLRNGTTSIVNITLTSTNLITQIALSNVTIDNIQVYVTSGTSINTQMAISIEQTDSVTEYEPFGVKIPISSASTTTPVYLGEVETTRRIKKLVLTGEEPDWSIVENYTYFRLPNFADGIVGQVVCSHYVSPPNAISIYNTVQGIKIQDSSSYGRILIVRPPNFMTETLSGFKTYLAQQYANGTPVTVWYVLATAETGIVNEPIRKIGDYADTVSGISIPTISGANSFDVLTTLKPSEVTANYHGWHPVADVHERESGAWT